jgi:hypothetical protein
MSSISRILLASIQCHPRAVDFCLESYLRAAISKASSILPLGCLPAYNNHRIQVLFRSFPQSNIFHPGMRWTNWGIFFGNWNSNSLIFVSELVSMRGRFYSGVNHPRLTLGSPCQLRKRGLECRSRRRC